MALPTGETGSAFLHRMLCEVAAQFPDELNSARLPTDPKAFRARYGDALARFESARVQSSLRTEIARELVTRTHGSMFFVDDRGTRSLAQALAEKCAVPTFRTLKLTGRPGMQADIPWAGEQYQGSRAQHAIDDLHAQHHMTRAAHRALSWSVEHINSKPHQRLSLEGERFALLGAGAELAPTVQLLEAGATVLWIDRVSPEESIGTARLATLAGTIVVPSDPAVSDLLSNPSGVSAAIREFSTQQSTPVHVGLFAYAPGGGQELRLAAAMDAIVRSLGSDVVRSVLLLISPTSPAEVQREDIEYAALRASNRPFWQGVLEKVRMLRRPGHACNGAAVGHAVVSLQGPGYQAAQYLMKVASGESLAVHGLNADEPGSSRVKVSATIAGITSTRSLEHPLFLVAFQGAPAFGVRIFESGTTRALGALVLLHDLYGPNAAGSPESVFATGAERATAMRAVQIHGGVFNMPWKFEDAVRSAAFVGAGRKPSLLLRALKK